MTKSQLIKIFLKTERLQTERLILRKLMPSDYRDMFEYSCLSEVTKYLLWYPHENENQTYRYLEEIQYSYKRGEFFDWAVVLKDSGKMIGTCGYTSFDLPNKRVEIGYVLNSKYWGCGYAPEAIKAAIEFAFAELEFNRAEAHFIEGNSSSLKAAEKCGMTFEGILKDYMLIKGEFKSIGILGVTKDKFPFSNCYTIEKNKSGWLKNLIN